MLNWFYDGQSAWRDDNDSAGAILLDVLIWRRKFVRFNGVKEKEELKMSLEKWRGVAVSERTR